MVALSYKIINEEGTRYVTKINDEAKLIHLWIEYDVNGEKRRKRYGFSLDVFDSGKWEVYVKRDLKEIYEREEKIKLKTNKSRLNKLKKEYGKEKEV